MIDMMSDDSPHVGDFMIRRYGELLSKAGIARWQPLAVALLVSIGIGISTLIVKCRIGAKVPA
jgi:hypothetical protein